MYNSDYESGSITLKIKRHLKTTANRLQGSIPIFFPWKNVNFSPPPLTKL